MAKDTVNASPWYYKWVIVPVFLILAVLLLIAMRIDLVTLLLAILVCPALALLFLVLTVKALIARDSALAIKRALIFALIVVVGVICYVLTRYVFQ